MNFDAALLSRGYLVDVADPGGYLLSDWTCDGGYNIAHYCDPETDQMIEEATAIEDLDERAAAYQRDRRQAAERSRQRLPPPRERASGAPSPTSTNFQPHPLEYYVLTADLALGG